MLRTMKHATETIHGGWRETDHSLISLDGETLLLDLFKCFGTTVTEVDSRLFWRTRLG